MSAMADKRYSKRELSVGFISLLLLFVFIYECASHTVSSSFAEGSFFRKNLFWFCLILAFLSGYIAWAVFRRVRDRFRHNFVLFGLLIALVPVYFGYEFGVREEGAPVTGFVLDYLALILSGG